MRAPQKVVRQLFLAWPAECGHCDPERTGGAEFSRDTL
jgi:hypothetical protein